MRLSDEPPRFRVRRYCASDRIACLALFRSNLPRSFTRPEYGDFSKFLKTQSVPYFVVVDERDHPVACGGHALDRKQRTATLCWGLVGREWQHRGLGKLLLLYRLARISRLGDIDRVLMDTSEHAVGFFKKYGFRVLRTTPNGYRRGLHQLDLSLRLTPARRARFARLFAAARS